MVKLNQIKDAEEIVGHLLTPGAFKNVCTRWASPHRKFHTVKHFLTVINNLPQTPMYVLAALYHDAIYIPCRAQNEEKSAKLLEADAKDTTEAKAIAREAARIIRSTSEFQHKEAEDEEAFFLADCSILNESNWVDLLEYERQVEEEFEPYVTPSNYRFYRAKFLFQSRWIFPNNAVNLLKLRRHVLDKPRNDEPETGVNFS